MNDFLTVQQPNARVYPDPYNARNTRDYVSQYYALNRNLGVPPYALQSLSTAKQPL